jgi:hypothetical protein
MLKSANVWCQGKVMMVHLHSSEERFCDNCECRSVIFDVWGVREARGLSLCQQCFRDFTRTLVEAASRLKGDPEAGDPGKPTTS